VTVVAGKVVAVAGFFGVVEFSLVNKKKGIQNKGIIMDEN